VRRHKLRLELDEQEVRDKLDARKNREREQAAAQQAAERQAEERRRHEAWIEEWSERALWLLPSGVSGSPGLRITGKDFRSFGYGKYSFMSRRFRTLMYRKRSAQTFRTTVLTASFLSPSR